MGQVLSNIIGQILHQFFPPASPPALRAKPSTSAGELLQTRLSSSPTLDSCSDSRESCVLNPLLDWRNKSKETEHNRSQNQSESLHVSSSSLESLGDDSSSDGELQQAWSYVSNPLLLNWSNKSDTEQNQPQDILISSSSSESLGNDLSSDSALERAQSNVSVPPPLNLSRCSSTIRSPSRSPKTYQENPQNASIFLRPDEIGSQYDVWAKVFKDLEPLLDRSNEFKDTEQNRLQIQPQPQPQEILISLPSSEWLGNDLSSDSALERAQSNVSIPPPLNWSRCSSTTGSPSRSPKTYQENPQNASIFLRPDEIGSHYDVWARVFKHLEPLLDRSNEFKDTEQNRLQIQPQPQEILVSLPSSERSLGDDLSSDGGALQRDEEEEEEKERSKAVVVIEEIWMKHYSSRQKILLVGEGDFSFSASLAVAFGSATNIIATSLNSVGFLRKNYGHAMSNIHKLRIRGAKIFHDVDATEMANLFMFEGMTFDRIIFNFPHVGIWKNESRELSLWQHQKLIRLFMANAKTMIAEDGEIHVTHKSNGFFCEWNLRQLGSSEGLQLIEEVHFNFRDYPGYCTKFGFGGDKNFNCNPSKTYKFGLQIRDCSRSRKKKIEVAV